MTMRVAIGIGLAVLANAAHAQTAPQLVEAAVLVRTIEKGEVLSASDFAGEMLAPPLARGATDPGRAAGMEAIRRLQAGSAVRASDLIRPQLVRRGEPVTILVRSGALSITAQGRALSGGGAGDLVRVVTSGSRTLDGIVEKTGRVRIRTN